MREATISGTAFFYPERPSAAPRMQAPHRLCPHPPQSPNNQARARSVVWLQVLKDTITEGVLTGERAIFYAFGFSLPSFKVHHIITAQMSTKLYKAPAGHAALKIAWDMVDSMCDLMILMPCRACMPMLPCWRCSAQDHTEHGGHHVQFHAFPWETPWPCPACMLR